MSLLMIANGSAKGPKKLKELAVSMSQSCQFIWNLMHHATAHKHLVRLKACDTHQSSDCIIQSKCFLKQPSWKHWSSAISPKKQGSSMWDCRSEAALLASNSALDLLMTICVNLNTAKQLCQLCLADSPMKCQCVAMHWEHCHHRFFFPTG